MQDLACAGGPTIAQIRDRASYVPVAVLIGTQLLGLEGVLSERERRANEPVTPELLELKLDVLNDGIGVLVEIDDLNIGRYQVIAGNVLVFDFEIFLDRIQV